MSENVKRHSSRARQHLTESCLIVWLCPSDTTDLLADTLGECAQVYKFSANDPAIDFITDVTDEKVFLISSTMIESHLLSLLGMLSQVHGIYLWNLSVEEEANCSEQSRKMLGNFHNVLTLGAQLKNDIRLVEKEIFTFHVLPTSFQCDVTDESPLSKSSQKKTVNQQDAIFMYSTIARELLCTMEDDTLHKNTIEYCRERYKDNSHALTMIDEFGRDCDRYSPVTWYTRETFLYKMLNKALRVNDVKTLFFFHNYIRHLHEQLATLHEQSPLTKPLVLYRGQQMPTTEFDSIRTNTGGLLSVANFLSTTARADMAEIFAGHSLDDPMTSCIVFEISLLPTACAFPFADVSQHSQFANAEQEYLFSMGAVFRIGSVRQRHDKVWTVDLTLTDDNDEKLAELKESLTSDILDENPMLALGGLLIRMGEYEQAEFFYRIALTMENEPMRAATVWNQLGVIFSHLDRVEDSKDCYENVLRLKRKHLDKDALELAVIYNNLGTIHREQGDHQRALQHFQHALAIYLANPTVDQEHLAVDYSNIGSIYIDLGKLEEAYSFYKRAHEVNLGYLPANHPNLASSYYFLAMASYGLGQYAETIDCMQKTLAIDEEALPPHHPTKIFHEQNLKALTQRIFERVLTGSIVLED